MHSRSTWRQRMSWVGESVLNVEKGHFQNAKVCAKRKQKAAVGRVEGELSDTDSGGSINRLTEDVKQTENLVMSVKGLSSRKAGVEIQAYNHGRPGT